MSGIVWTKSPRELAVNLKRYDVNVRRAIFALAAYFGQQTQDDARRSARWEDRTGNARSGLFFAVDGFGLSPITGYMSGHTPGEQGDVAIESGGPDTVVLCLSHTMVYGKYLELSNGGRYAIIASTLQKNLPALEGRLRQLLAS